MPDDEPLIVVDPPDVPPTARAMTFALTGTSLALTGFGIIDLVLAMLADCLNTLNLFLGLAQVAIGLAVLAWTLSWWLSMCRRHLAEDERRIRRYEKQLRAYHTALDRWHRSDGSGEAPAPPSRPDRQSR